jgi:hypothetical protein
VEFKESKRFHLADTLTGAEVSAPATSHFEMTEKKMALEIKKAADKPPRQEDATLLLSLYSN